VLLTVFRITLDRTRRNWVKLIASTLSLVVFGSLSSTAALLCALAIFAGYYSFSNSRYLTMFVWCIVGGLTVFQVALFFLTDLSTLVSSGVTGAGAALNKTPEMLANWTGRVPLWIAIWDATKDTLWGDGFAAAERLFALNHPSFGWQARHSHNGYIAAWMGAGWIGFVLLLFVFGSVWIRSRRMVLTVRAMICSTLVLLAINNLTLAAIGGSFNPMYVLMMALTCVSPAYFARASHKPNDNFAPPVGTV
jgi:O-antigen ligase